MRVPSRRPVVPLVALFAVVAAGCAYRRTCIRPEDPTAPSREAVYVKFLGVGGFLIRLGDDAILTAPLYTNPTIGEIALQKVHPDHRLIEALLPPVDDVEAILSGHSHFDHLMDVPYVAVHRAQRAVIYGNDEMPKLLGSLATPKGPLENRLVSLETLARDKVESLRCLADCTNVQAYTQVGNVRIWPIVSEHSPQFKVSIPFVGRLPDVHLWRGTLMEPPGRLPDSVSGWVEGTALAYLIDFMDGDRVAFRVYYQDSGTRDPYGFPPKCLLKQKAVDLALLCAGGTDFEESHPGAIVEELKPRHVIAGHWESFLNPRTLPLPNPRWSPKDGQCKRFDEAEERIEGIPFTKPRNFAKRLRKALPPGGAYSMPCPDAWTQFAKDGDHWSLQSWSEEWTPGKK